MAVQTADAHFTSALTQDISISFGNGDGQGDNGLTERAIQLIAIITVLSLLRTAIGLQTAPPNAVIISLALFLTGFVMAPAFQTVYCNAVRPLVAGELQLEQAFERGATPFRAFMMQNVREKDLGLFMDRSREARPETPEATPLRVLMPAFMISELRRAIEIGSLLFVPFLVIDAVIALELMSIGMMMLPVIVSLPFTLIFFVLVDGWSLVAGSLVQSFGT